MKLPYGCRVSGAPACRQCQFAPVAPLRSALHSNRTFTTRGLYFIDRCGGVPPVRARTGQFAAVAPLRSALHSYRTFVTRGLYLIDRCGGVLFPVALVPSAAKKTSLRVQSERSERLRELTPAARRPLKYKGLFFLGKYIIMGKRKW